MQPKSLIPAEAKKSPIKDVLNYLNDIFTSMIGLSLGHLYNHFGIKKVAKSVTRQIILVKICYKLLYVIQVV